MNFKDIYSRKRKNWSSLIRMRRQEEEAKHGSGHSQNGPGHNQNGSDHNHSGLDHKNAKPDRPESKKLELKRPDSNSPEARIDEICDPNSFKELFQSLGSADPLDFPGYDRKKKEYQDRTGREDAFLAGTARIHKRKVAIGFLDGNFLMGSMGCAVGEKVCLLTEYAQKKELPLIIFSASGGARMQEGMFSLVQMAKSAAAIDRFKKNGGLYISCLTHPTSGGVSASFASLGDIILAEPHALICFAGPRVIEQTIGQTLPEGFQRSEFLLEHGMIDRITERKNCRKVLNHILYLHGIEKS